MVPPASKKPKKPVKKTRVVAPAKQKQKESKVAAPAARETAGNRPGSGRKKKGKDAAQGLNLDQSGEPMVDNVQSDDSVDEFFGLYGDTEAEAEVPAIASPVARAEDAAPRLRISEGNEIEATEAGAASGIGRSSDPVRMYLREMGGVSLLTREGEVVIAKRIEEGLNEILYEVYRSPIALEYVIELAEGLKEGTVRVRDLFEEEDTSNKEEEEEEEEEVVSEDEDGEVKEAAPPVEKISPDEEEIKKTFYKKVSSLKKSHRSVAEIFEKQVVSSPNGKNFKELGSKYEKLRVRSAEKLIELQLAKRHTDEIINRMKAHVVALSESEKIFRAIEKEVDRP